LQQAPPDRPNPGHDAPPRPAPPRVGPLTASPRWGCGWGLRLPFHPRVSVCRSRPFGPTGPDPRRTALWPPHPPSCSPFTLPAGSPTSGIGGLDSIRPLRPGDTKPGAPNPHFGLGAPGPAPFDHGGWVSPLVNQPADGPLAPAHRGPAFGKTAFSEPRSSGFLESPYSGCREKRASVRPQERLCGRCFPRKVHGRPFLTRAIPQPACGSSFFERPPWGGQPPPRPRPSPPAHYSASPPLPLPPPIPFLPATRPPAKSA